MADDPCGGIDDDDILKKFAGKKGEVEFTQWHPASTRYHPGYIKGKYRLESKGENRPRSASLNLLIYFTFAKYAVDATKHVIGNGYLSAKVAGIIPAQFPEAAADGCRYNHQQGVPPASRCYHYRKANGNRRNYGKVAYQHTQEYGQIS